MFFKLVLPKLKRRVSSKMLIRNNWSSHISFAVIDACQKKRHHLQVPGVPASECNYQDTTSVCCSVCSAEGSLEGHPERVQVLASRQCFHQKIRFSWPAEGPPYKSSSGPASACWIQEMWVVSGVSTKQHGPDS
jgi:hypothetical protein